jgi:cephalosporin hydroxylase
MKFKKYITALKAYFEDEKVSSSLRRREYDEKLEMSLKEWLLRHQREIVFDRVTWMGRPVWKNVMDAWIYQEIAFEVRPDVIVEIGSKFGGSTGYFADLLELLKNGVVVSVDIDRSEYDLVHDRVIALTGKSSDPDILARVEEICLDRKTMVVQDGAHFKKQVLEDLANYSKFVSPGSYFIVEDGIVDLFHDGDGLGFRDPGPLAAVEEFLKNNPDFESDLSRERYLLTYNPKGFLKRKADD